MQSAIGIALGDADHQPQIGLDQLLLGATRFRTRSLDNLHGAPQFGRGRAVMFFELQDPLVELLLFLAQVADLIGAGRGRFDFRKLAAICCSTGASLPPPSAAG